MGSSSVSIIKKFEIYRNEIELQRQVYPRTFCESVGRKAAIFGYEKGLVEAWIYPFKIVSDLQFSVSVPQYHFFIHGVDIARRIIVRPEMTTLVFSHDLFTIQWHLLTPLNESGCIFLFDVDTYLPIELWISFIPNLIPMWPAGLGGQYSIWLADLNAYYIGEGSKQYAGVIGSPVAQRLSNTPGHQLPDDPLKFVIKVSKEFAVENFVPIIIAGSTEGKDKALQQFLSLLNSIHESYQRNYNHYQRLRSDFMVVQTPVPELDQAFEWAKVSLDKGLVENPHLGTGLVAGYGVSGKSQRPGFAWFFGGDTFLNSLAINGYGDFETTRQALTILRDNQRPDGKIFHELTQSAALVNWFQDYPYGFYHAETSAFYIIAMHHYLVRSGDESFIRESWNSIKMAYFYCLAADEDHDGLMENSAAGLAAMEVGEMLDQNRVDIYLAASWLRALKCMIYLSQFFKEITLKQKCQEQFEKAYQSFTQIFVDEKKKQLNFALLTNGDKHTDATVWQSIPIFFDLIEADKISNTMQQFASSEISTDWGVRGVSRKSKYYDPISYNNGSVWPFTTGYVATAQYKHHRSINGWHNLMANARLTWLDALGWHTELLSGEYYQPVTTSVPHQLFSASGIINPLVMGVLGLESDAIHRKIQFAPHLPLDWNELIVKNYYCGEDQLEFLLQRSDEKLHLEIIHQGLQTYQFVFSPAFGLGSEVKKVLVNQIENDYELKTTRYDVHCEIECDLVEKLSIEIYYQQGMEINIPRPEPPVGSRSHGLKLIDYELSNNIFTMIVEGLGGYQYVILLKSGFEIEKVEGAEVKKVNRNIWELVLNFENKSSTHFIKRKIIFPVGIA